MSDVFASGDLVYSVYQEYGSWRLRKGWVIQIPETDRLGVLTHKDAHWQLVELDSAPGAKAIHWHKSIADAVNEPYAAMKERHAAEALAITSLLGNQ